MSNDVHFSVEIFISIATHHSLVPFTLLNDLTMLIDDTVELIELIVDVAHESGTPVLADTLKLSQLSALTNLLLVFEDCLNLVLDSRERHGHDLDEEVVHHISVVTVVDDARRRRLRSHVDLASAHVLLFLVETVHALVFLTDDLGLLLHQVLVAHAARRMILHDHIHVVVHLDVHLHGVDDVEVAASTLDVTGEVWHGALTSQNLCQIVVLDSGKTLTVIFGATAAKIVQVVDQLEDAPMHHHELHDSHGLV